jgi:hypothetical protein
MCRWGRWLLVRRYLLQCGNGLRVLLTAGCRGVVGDIVQLWRQIPGRKSVKTEHTEVNFKIVPQNTRLVAYFWPRRPELVPSAIHMGFVDKVALGQVFLRILRFSSFSINSTAALFTHVSSGGWKMLPSAVAVKQTQSHTIVSVTIS